MNSKSYKYCSVIPCISTTKNNPKKIFFHVPREINKRKRWLELAERNPAELSPKSTIYFCEDHFDLENDMENYMELHIMGKTGNVRLKKGSLPSKFPWRRNKNKSDSPFIVHPVVEKRQKIELLQPTVTNKNVVQTPQNTNQFHFAADIGIKPHKCKICFKQFTRKHDLSIHERRHTSTGFILNQTDGLSDRRDSFSENCNKILRPLPSENQIQPNDLDLTFETKIDIEQHEITMDAKLFEGNFSKIQKIKQEEPDLAAELNRDSKDDIQYILQCNENEVKPDCSNLVFQIKRETEECDISIVEEKSSKELKPIVKLENTDFITK